MSYTIRTEKYPDTWKPPKQRGDLPPPTEKSGSPCPAFSSASPSKSHEPPVQRLFQRLGHPNMLQGRPIPESAGSSVCVCVEITHIHVCACVLISVHVYANMCAYTMLNMHIQGMSYIQQLPCSPCHQGMAALLCLDKEYIIHHVVPKTVPHVCRDAENLPSPSTWTS